MILCHAVDLNLYKHILIDETILDHDHRCCCSYLTATIAMEMFAQHLAESFSHRKAVFMAAYEHLDSYNTLGTLAPQCLDGLDALFKSDSGLLFCISRI